MLKEEHYFVTELAADTAGEYFLLQFPRAGGYGSTYYIQPFADGYMLYTERHILDEENI